MAHTGSSSRLLDLLSAEGESSDEVADVAERLKEPLQQLMDSAEDAHVGAIHEVEAEGRERLVDIELQRLGKWLDEIHSRIAEPIALVRGAYDLGRSTSLASVGGFRRDIEEAHRLHSLEHELRATDADLTEACGERYRGADTDWENLIAASEWTVEVAGAFRAANVVMPESFVHWAHDKGERLGTREQADVVLGRLDAAQGCIDGLAMLFDPDTFRVDDRPPEQAAFGRLRERLQAMASRVSELDDWVDACRTRNALAEAGLTQFAGALWGDPPAAEELVACARASALRGWLHATYASDPRLREFRVEDHQRLLREFGELDRLHWELGTARVVSRTASRQSTSGYVPAGSERAVLLKEAHKKRRHLPIRRLFEQIRSLILELKPCLLMSPLSVSQFLPPDVSFDVVVFDEASQICTEDAVGAIYRGKQVLICGDQRQLPPTDFFQKTLDEDAEEFSPDEDITIESYESVLDECLANGMREAWLRWHYRSKDERLIAFSNDRFYDYRLVTFPSARGDDAQLGVEFVHVPAGVYDRGGRRTNVVEARRVVDVALEHLARHPSKSLGIVSFSISQTQAIEDELERRAAGNASLDVVVVQGRQNGFFVKNLENVQGDERDVMLFSIGYGRDQGGRLTMNFGPLNQSGGERRLNVAITRARERVILVSSIRAADLDLSATQSPGVRHLYSYLDYAERGLGALREAPNFGSREYESPLEKDVAGEIRRLGYDVDAQVGCSGYRIDLGVRSPGQPGRYVLGVECDGATYHSAYTARDRDRLRQQVLEAQGWRIHRIWSPAWFRRRDDEVERLDAAIRAAERDAEAVASDGHGTPELGTRGTAPPVSSVAVEMDVHVALDGPSWAEPYTPCELPFLPWSDQEFHDPSCTTRHAEGIAQVVAEEGPVHIDVVARRLATA